MSIYYSKEHEWILVAGDQATIGITQHAAEQLGDIVFIELPDTGASLSAHDEAGVIESVKAASELYAPITGVVRAINQAVIDEPALVNQDPMQQGWLLKMTISDASELESLLDEAGYQQWASEQA